MFWIFQEPSLSRRKIGVLIFPRTLSSTKDWEDTLSTKDWCSNFSRNPLSLSERLVFLFFQEPSHWLKIGRTLSQPKIGVPIFREPSLSLSHRKIGFVSFRFYFIYFCLFKHLCFIVIFPTYSARVVFFHLCANFPLFVFCYFLLDALTLAHIFPLNGRSFRTVFSMYDFAKLRLPLFSTFSGSCF